jgi:hypothetical protein
VHRSSLAIFILLAGSTGAFAQASAPSRPSFPSAPSFPAAPSFPSAASMPSASDARATAIADRVMDALGGKEAWDATRFLRFTFGSERDGKFMGRTHNWDKWTGRYRVEGDTRDGLRFVILMNLNTREGSAWLAGRQMEGAELKAQLERGYGMWVNDTYWLLMPYKMRDPGVILSYAGEETDGGAMYDKVKLTFENVGLTPRDAYWVWVNRDTGLVDRWDYVLKGENVPPTTWRWSSWKKYGGIMLSGERTNAADGHKIMLPDIAVLEGVPDPVFTSPDPIG